MISTLLCLISGFMLSLAFPKANLYWVAWFAISPLIYCTFQGSWKRPLLCGLAFGFGFFAGLMYWIALFGWLPLIALSVYQSLYVVAFVAAARLLGARQGYWGRLVLLPALWMVIEWTRSLGSFGFTWGDLSYSQYKALYVIQIAGVTGAWGISFLIMLSNTALANFLTARRTHRETSGYAQLAATAVIVLSVLFFGMLKVGDHSRNTGRVIRAGVIQGDISQDTNDWMAYSDNAWRTYIKLTREAAREKANLIVWPETAVPGVPGTDPFVQERLRKIAEAAKANMVVGGWDESGSREFNSAFLVRPGLGIADRYAKVHLVPFGEFVPARKYLPFLKYYSVRSVDTSPGAGYNVLNAGSYKIGTAICFESAFPCIARAMARSGANLLCVITDDEWFGKTAAAEQHLSMSVLRAVENSRYLVRGACTGISCIIDPHGEILSKTDWWHPEVLSGDVRLRSETTIYGRYGDWLIYASIVFLLALTLLCLLFSKRGTESAADCSHNEIRRL